MRDYLTEMTDFDYPRTVASALNGMGIGRERVAMRGYGEAYPVAGNASAGDKQLNRRVEIVLSNEGVAIPPRR